MTTLKHIRYRLNTLQSAKKITSAMKMVSGAKLKRYQDLFQHITLLHDQADNIVQKTSNLIIDQSLFSIFTAKKKAPPLFLLFTGERGLCGSLNQNILRAFKKEVESQTNYRYCVLGHKGQELLKAYPQQDRSVDLPSLIGKETAKTWVDLLLEWRRQEKIGDIFCIRPKFKNVLSITSKVEPLLPFTFSSEALSYGLTEPYSSTLIYDFYKDFLQITLYAYHVETQICEQASRMTAMDQATRNASNLIEKLRLLYNQTRQTQITKELIEIVSSAEAVMN